MEWEALPSALERVFPEQEFYSLPTRVEVESQEDIEFPASSFTSCDVRNIRSKENNADKLVQRASAEAVGNRDQKPADLVIIIDDLELDNLHQSEEVVATLREAAERFLHSLDYNAKARTRHTEALRRRVSFHIVKPMIEGWILGDPNGPEKAGVPASSLPPIVLPGIDPEHFQTTDQSYLADTGKTCTCWLMLPENTSKQKKIKRKHTPQWIKADPRRELHPKGYLSWLCRDPEEKNCSTYAETDGGVVALSELDWNALLQNPQHGCFVRSMLHDIADALGVTAPFPGRLAPETANKTSVATSILRNI